MWAYGCLLMGWNTATCGLNQTEPVSGQNRGSGTMKCRLRFVITGPLLKGYNKTIQVSRKYAEELKSLIY